MEVVRKFQNELESRLQTLVKKLQCFFPLLFQDASEEAAEVNMTSEEAAELMAKLKKLEASLTRLEEKLETYFPLLKAVAVVEEGEVGGDPSSNPVAHIPVNNTTVAVVVEGELGGDTRSNPMAQIHVNNTIKTVNTEILTATEKTETPTILADPDTTKRPFEYTKVLFDLPRLSGVKGPSSSKNNKSKKWKKY